MKKEIKPDEKRYVDELETVEFLPFEQLQTRFFGGESIPVTVTYGGSSNVGRVRKNNEDHFVVMRRRRSQSLLLSNLPVKELPNVHEDAYAFAVADGMGGEVFGNLASMLALQTGMSLSQNEINWSLRVDDHEALEILEKIEVYLNLMDQALIAHARSHPETGGMGTTLTVAYTVGFNAFIGHVGDSRIYLARGEMLKRLTRDHTLGEELNGDEGLSPEEMRQRNHILTNCLGGPEEGIYAETHHVPLEPNDRLLLCTDGLTDLVNDAKILSLLLDHSEPQKAADALVQAALEAGGRDNVTVVIADFSLNH